MNAALHIRTTVLPGKRIEVSAPELPEGTAVDVFLVLPTQPTILSPDAPPRFGSVLDFLESLPKSPSPRAFATWEEYEKHLQAERDSWDR